jgi:hypothetical protein
MRAVAVRFRLAVSRLAAMPYSRPLYANHASLTPTTTHSSSMILTDKAGVKPIHFLPANATFH